MTDTKAALDALEKLARIAFVNTSNDVHSVEENVELVESIKAALTAPPAPTVTGDDVREAVADFKNARQHDDDQEYVIWMTKKKNVETLIRAATQPPQGTDAQRQAALEDLAKVDYHPRSVDDGHYDAGFDQEQAGDFLDKHINTVYAALQSTAVPRELVTALEDANQMCRSMYQIAARGGKDTNWSAFTSRLEKELDRQHKALALLGGKEG